MTDPTCDAEIDGLLAEIEALQEEMDRSALERAALTERLKDVAAMGAEWSI